MPTYNRSTTVDPLPGGDSVKQAVLDLDTDLTSAYTGLNTLDTGKEPTLTGATADTAPADADTVYGGNAGSAFATIKTTWTVIKAFLKTYFDTLYSPIAGPGSAQAFSTGALSVNVVSASTTAANLSGVNGYILVDNVGSGLSYYHATSGHIFSGRVEIDIPTSAAGLPTGSLWRNGNVVNIV